MAYIKDENGMLKNVLTEKEWDAIDRLWTASKYDDIGFIANCEEYGEYGDVFVDTEEEVIRPLIYGLLLLEANDLQTLADEGYDGCSQADIDILRATIKKYNPNNYKSEDDCSEPLPIDYNEYCSVIGY